LTVPDLLSCPRCKRSIRTDLAACPHCGLRVRVVKILTKVGDQEHIVETLVREEHLERDGN
jgi:predicted amidophosphoribosyltransferase